MLKSRAIVMAMGILLMTGTTFAAVTPGAIAEFIAGSNAGHPGNWNNLVGGNALVPITVGGFSGAPARVTLGGIDAYTFEPVASAWQQTDLTDMTGLDNGFSFEILLQKQGTNFSTGDHWLSRWSSGGSGLGEPYSQGQFEFWLTTSQGNTTDPVERKTLGFYLKGGAGAAYRFSNKALTVDGWDHFVLVYDDNTDQGKLYYNGALFETISWDNSLDIPSVNADLVALGITPDQGGSARFRGAIAVNRMYNFLLTDQQVQDNYNAALNIPEPASLSLLALGGLLLRRRQTRL